MRDGERRKIAVEPEEIGCDMLDRLRERRVAREPGAARGADVDQGAVARGEIGQSIRQAL